MPSSSFDQTLDLGALKAALTNAAMLALPNGLNSPFAIQHSPFANNGKSPFDSDEPGLAELIHRVAVEKGSFRVTYDSLREVSAEAGAVGAPFFLA